MGIAFWLVPPRALRGQIAQVMRIRKDHSTVSPASYPSFEPHITLASLPSDCNIPIDKLKESIPVDQGAFPVTFESVEVGDHYFRSVYVKIRLPLGDSELAKLHRRVHDEHLGLQPNTPKFPHMSLCYIADEDAEERQNYYDDLKEKKLMKVTKDGIELRSSPVNDWFFGFQVKEIWIVKCEGSAENWEVLERIELK